MITRTCGFLVLALAGLVTVSVTNASSDDETRADMRCIIVGGQLVASKDAEQRSSGGMLIIYYLGRLDARLRSIDLERLLEAEILRMTPAVYRSEAKRCGDVLSAKGRQIANIGSKMTSPTN